MRLIGQFPEKLPATRFVDVLAGHQIEASAEQGNQGWGVWVREEDSVSRGKQLYQEFLADSRSSQMLEAEKNGERWRKQRLEQSRGAAKPRVVQMSDRWRRPLTRNAPLSTALLIICIAVSLLTQFGSTRGLAQAPTTFSEKLLLSLLVVDPQAYVKANEGEVTSETTESLEFRTWSIRRGEIWRLWTPCLIHFGVIHLLFNMLMLHRLGTIMESLYGTKRYALFLLACGIVSNVGCYIPQDGPGLLTGGGWLSGGMSGVLYGLFGWALARDKFSPDGFKLLHSQTVFMLLAWLVIGMMGLLDDPAGGSRINNWAHGVGFVFGLAVGYVAAQVRRT